MSIINEALKKAGEQPETQPAQAEMKKNDAIRPQPLRRRNQRMNWGPIFIISILVLITTPLLAPVFNRPYQDHSAGTGSTMKAQFAVEEAALPQAARPAMPFRPSFGTPDYALTGLVYSKDGSYCLINGQVVKVGESIGGAKLISVTPNEAVLEYRGETLVLPANA